MIKKLYLFSIYFFVFCCGNIYSQNIKSSFVKTLYYYRTESDFFKKHYDSICADITYNYGKIYYKDEKTGKKIKYRLLKDSSFFAFRLRQVFTSGSYLSPVFVSHEKEKAYGVYLGGNEKFYMAAFSRGDSKVTYDDKFYVTSGAVWSDQFGYNLRFVKKDYAGKPKHDIDAYIKDNAELFNKYNAERFAATTQDWVRVFLSKQLQYLRAYNND